MKVVKPFRMFKIYFKYVSYMAIFTITCYKFFIKFKSFFFHSKPSEGKIWDIFHPYRLFASQYMIIMCLIVVFQILIACYCISMHCMTYSSSNIPFIPLITYQYQLMILIILLSFLSMLAMLILVLIKYELNEAHIFQIHLQAIVCHFERTNRDTHLDFSLKSFSLRVYSQHL